MSKASQSPFGLHDCDHYHAPKPLLISRFISREYQSALSRSAFTLIELLIVVAIIAILAAIAVPNFLEAQVRAKIARAKADQRTITTGLETYHIDQNSYPKSNAESWALSFGAAGPMMIPTLERLTTPISYLSGSATFTDPFVGTAQYWGANLLQEENIAAIAAGYHAQAGAQPGRVYRYISRGPKDTTIWNQPNDEQKAVWYLLESCGPDAHYHRMGTALNSNDSPARRGVLYKAIYDPTNGTVSRGSIWRAGGASGRGDFFKEMVNRAN